MLTKFISNQLGFPSGIIGRAVLPRLLNRRNSALNNLALECLQLQPCDRVLEVGFGGGYLLDRMSAIVSDGLIAGVDVSPAMVSFCEKRYRSLIGTGRLDVILASAEDLPFPPGNFTKACTVNTIFYWKDPRLALKELWRTLERHGFLIICFTCKEYLQDRSFIKHGLKLYETNEVYQLMEKAGFDDISMIYSSDRHRNFVCAVGNAGEK